MTPFGDFRDEASAMLDDALALIGDGPDGERRALALLLIAIFESANRCGPFVAFLTAIEASQAYEAATPLMTTPAAGRA